MQFQKHTFLCKTVISEKNQNMERTVLHTFENDRSLAILQYPLFKKIVYSIVDPSDLLFEIVYPNRTSAGLSLNRISVGLT